MSKLIFHPDVSIEVKASYTWYQKQAQGLGDDFLHELKCAFDTVENFPDTWPKFNKHYRRFLLGKFPFSVIYRIHSNSVFVVAIMHNSRKPGYWKARL